MYLPLASIHNMRAQYLPWDCYVPLLALADTCDRCVTGGMCYLNAELNRDYQQFDHKFNELADLPAEAQGDVSEMEQTVTLGARNTSHLVRARRLSSMLSVMSDSNVATRL